VGGGGHIWLKNAYIINGRTLNVFLLAKLSQCPNFPFFAGE